MTRSVTKRQEAYEAGSLVVAGDRAVGNSRGTIIATTGAAPTPRAPNELSVRELFERFRLENEIGFEWAWESSGFARGPAPDLGPGRSPLAAAAERIASAGRSFRQFAESPSRYTRGVRRWRAAASRSCSSRPGLAPPACRRRRVRVAAPTTRAATIQPVLICMPFSGGIRRRSRRSRGRGRLSERSGRLEEVGEPRSRVGVAPHVLLFRVSPRPARRRGLQVARRER
jgi:hypothetical protein